MADPNTPQHQPQLQYPQSQQTLLGASVPSPSRSTGQAGPTAQQWAQVTGMLRDLHGQLQATTAELAELKRTSSTNQGTQPKAKINKPGSFSGKAYQVESWCAHMDTYVRSETPQEALDIALSYLEGEAFSWWRAIGSNAGISTWDELSEHLQKRFSPLNKQESARDKLHRWRQTKDVSQFNADFQRIIADIPEITPAEAMDRYKRALKPYIWDALCLKKYESLEEMMTDALTMEASKRNRHPDFKSSKPNPSGQGPTPMDLSSVQVQKLTKEEREKCMRKGLCLRCRQKGHLARFCPKGQRRVAFSNQ